MDFAECIRKPIFAALAVCSFMLACGLAPIAAQNSKPNIVMLMTNGERGARAMHALLFVYQLGSRLNVNVDSKNDRLGLSLTQKGPIVGAEVSS